MTDGSLTQFGLSVVYTAVGVLIVLTERVEQSKALRIWSLSFFLFALDALLSGVRMTFNLSTALYSVSWVALIGASIAGVAGTVTFIGKPLPRGLFALGGAGLLAASLGIACGVDSNIVRAVVFACIGISFLWSARLTFLAVVPKCIGRWVVGSAFAGAGIYAFAWPIVCQLPGFSRLEFFIDFSLVMWGAAGALLVHLERSRQRIQQMVALELELRSHLERSERMEALGRLAGGVAHDFNNVLTTVIHGSELALRQLEDRPKTAAHIETVLEAARGASGFTRQLLALGRRRMPGKKPIRVNGAIRSALGMVKPGLLPNHQLSCTSADDTLTVAAGEGQLEQVIVNLALNALDAMPQGGTLCLEVEPKHDCVRFVLRDTGCGMDEATLKRVFEPFFSTKESAARSGLGLAAVYAIVQQLEGRIAVKSELGGGTCFTLELPRGGVPTASDIRPKQPGNGSAGVRILLVDEERSVLETLSAGLATSGYEVTLACSAAEALRSLDEKPPALLVTDVQMKGIAGLELVAQMRETHPSIPVILMTGHANDEELESGKHGAQLLLKPLTSERLQRAIDAALAG